MGFLGCPRPRPWGWAGSASCNVLHLCLGDEDVSPQVNKVYLALHNNKFIGCVQTSFIKSRYDTDKLPSEECLCFSNTETSHHMKIFSKILGYGGHYSCICIYGGEKRESKEFYFILSNNVMKSNLLPFLSLHKSPHKSKDPNTA